MKLELYQTVVVTRNIIEENLYQGDVATLVDYASHAEGGEDGAILEIFNAIGDSIGVVIVPASAVAPLRADLMPTVRALNTV